MFSSTNFSRSMTVCNHSTWPTSVQQSDISVTSGAVCAKCLLISRCWVLQDVQPIHNTTPAS